MSFIYQEHTSRTHIHMYVNKTSKKQWSKKSNKKKSNKHFSTSIIAQRSIP